MKRLQKLWGDPEMMNTQDLLTAAAQVVDALTRKRIASNIQRLRALLCELTFQRTPNHPQFTPVPEERRSDVARWYEFLERITRNDDPQEN